jgi:hypothetical protein
LNRTISQHRVSRAPSRTPKRALLLLLRELPHRTTRRAIVRSGERRKTRPGAPRTRTHAVVPTYGGYGGYGGVRGGGGGGGGGGYAPTSPAVVAAVVGRTERGPRGER